jgi:hypothetical protein
MDNPTTFMQALRKLDLQLQDLIRANQEPNHRALEAYRAFIIIKQSVICLNDLKSRYSEYQPRRWSGAHVTRCLIDKALQEAEQNINNTKETIRWAQYQTESAIDEHNIPQKLSATETVELCIKLQEVRQDFIAIASQFDDLRKKMNINMKKRQKSKMEDIKKLQDWGNDVAIFLEDGVPRE